jgi:hypothetical protein
MYWWFDCHLLQAHILPLKNWTYTPVHVTWFGFTNLIYSHRSAWYKMTTKHIDSFGVQFQTFLKQGILKIEKRISDSFVKSKQLGFSFKRTVNLALVIARTSKTMKIVWLIDLLSYSDIIFCSRQCNSFC